MEEIAMTVNHEKCTKLLAQIVEWKQRFLLNLMEPDLFIVKIVIENVDQVDTKKGLISYH